MQGAASTHDPVYGSQRPGPVVGQSEGTPTKDNPGVPSAVAVACWQAVMVGHLANSSMSPDAFKYTADPPPKMNSTPVPLGDSRVSAEAQPSPGTGNFLVSDVE